MKFLMLAVLLVVSLQLSSARVFTRCELAIELLRQNFARETLEHWVCLVEAESSRNTAVIGGPNWDGSYDHGLFQINDRYWCRVGSVGGVCNVDCSNSTCFVTNDPGQFCCIRVIECLKMPKGETRVVSDKTCGIVPNCLVTDDITVASACSKIIWNIHGFPAWYGWVSKCQGALPDLSSCGI